MQRTRYSLFMRKGKTTYLDFAASAPVSGRGKRAFLKALPVYGNPSSAHEAGRRASALLEESRKRVAREAGVKSDSVIFTSGATEANALLISGRIETLRRAGRSLKDIHVLYSAGAHASVIEAVRKGEREGMQSDTIAKAEGRIDLEQFKKSLREETALVLVDLVESETGAITDVRALRRILDEHYAGMGEEARPILHVDASQAPLVESIELPRVLSHTLSLDAQKIGGVRGAGALICPRSIALSPLLLGGGQERGLRSGTEAIALIASFSLALEEAGEMREGFKKRAAAFRKKLVESLLKASPAVLINEGKENAPHILNVSIPGRDTDYLQALLDAEGFSVSTRSACETDGQYSRAVLALTGDEARASSTLRISWGRETKYEELSAFSKAFSRSLSFLEASVL